MDYKHSIWVTPTEEALDKDIGLKRSSYAVIAIQGPESRTAPDCLLIQYGKERIDSGWFHRTNFRVARGKLPG
jgi:hypothetical protein